MKTEAYFVSHCDCEYCNLGSFDYTCPECNKYFSDYEVWWKQDEIYSGDKIQFNCEGCQINLIVSYDNKENEFIVESENETK